MLVEPSEVIEGCYDLSAQEYKVLLFIASMVQPQDIGFKKYNLKIKDFLIFSNIQNQSKYNEVPKAVDGLFSKTMCLTEKNKTTLIPWLSGITFGLGVVIVEFPANLKPYMLELKKLKPEIVVSLKSKYSIRIYEFLRLKKQKHIELSLERLKGMFLLGDDSTYSNYSNFKNRILLKAQSELKEKTDIRFEFEEIKDGKKVVAIKFHVFKNKKDM